MAITSSEQFLLHTTICFESHKTNKLSTRIRSCAYVKSTVKTERKTAYFTSVNYNLVTLGTQLFFDNK